MSKTLGTVYVVDDDLSIRRGLARLIGAMGLSVITFGSSVEFLDHERDAGPCCLVLDVCIPDMDGLTLQEELTRRRIDIPVVFITGYGKITMGVKAMKSGAVDFLEKPIDEEELSGAVHRALETDVRVLLRRKAREEVLSCVRTLTHRELEVMRWVLSGMLNRQIATEMHIEEKTVKVHRGRVMAKMRVASVADLVRMAEKAGIEPERK
jgi:FixJ family two-component response regulator